MAAAATRLVFQTLHGPIYFDGEGPFVDEVVIENPGHKLIKLASHAHASGAVKVSEGLDLSDVQSQEDGEAALVKAMGEHVTKQNADGTGTSYWTGPWWEGQVENARLAEEAGHSLADVGIDVDAAPEENE